MQEYHELGQKIQKIRKACGYSQRKLALASGISNTTISRLEAGLIEQPEIDTLHRIERALRLPENELVHLVYPALQGENTSTEGDGPGIRRIPVYQELQSKEPLFVQEKILSYEYHMEGHLTGENYFYLQVTGDWMTKSRIYPNDRVLVVSLPEYESDDIVVIQDPEGQVSIKRLIKAENMLVLQPDSYNPEHKTQIFTQRQFARARYKLIGKVLWAKIKL